MRGVDARVQFPDGKAPYDVSLAEATISFAGALAAGDDAAMGGMLDNSSRGILDSMLADGTWFDATDEIEAVRVVFMTQQPDGGDTADFSEFVLAIQKPGEAYTLGWSASNTDGGWVMSPISTVDLTLPRASDWDADSIGAYESERGWGSGGAPGGNPLGGAGFAEPNIPMALYVMQQMGEKLAGADLPAGMSLSDAFVQGLVMSGQATEDEAKKMLADGEAAVRRGEKPSTADAKMIIGSLLTTAQMAGMPWDEAQLLKVMADVVGISESEMREIYEG